MNKLLCRLLGHKFVRTRKIYFRDGEVIVCYVCSRCGKGDKR